jgi:hypothetical protein|tara:strand:- start:4322 stop:5092 length:771 start_codon:yes stop_codon:yes gene_type:complete
MTKVEIINEIISRKKEELQLAYKKTEKQANDRKAAALKLINEYFTPEEGITIAIGGYSESSFEFQRAHEDYNYLKELITLRTNEDWKTGEIKNINTSVYSTSDNSLWELERLRTVGQVAEILIDHQDDIVAGLNDIKNKLKVDRKPEYKIENEIKALRQEINDAQLKTASDLLNGKGLEFNGQKKGCIDIRHNWPAKYIQKAKILNKTKSGLSADIELTIAYTNGQEDIRTYEKVRMVNVEQLLWQYRDYVINAQA